MDPSVADPDPGSGALLIPGSEKVFSGSQTHIFDNFLGKKFYNSLKMDPHFFLQTSKNKIFYNFVKFVDIKKGFDNKFFYTPLFCYCF